MNHLQSTVKEKRMVRVHVQLLTLENLSPLAVGVLEPKSVPMLKCYGKSLAWNMPVAGFHQRINAG